MKKLPNNPEPPENKPQSYNPFIHTHEKHTPRLIISSLFEKNKSCTKLADINYTLPKNIQTPSLFTLHTRFASWFRIYIILV